MILVQEKHPAYSDISQCDIALTTVGANTAELGSLNIPMIVVVPTQHIVVMEAWDGFLGLIGRLPIFKRFLGILISFIKMRKRGFSPSVLDQTENKGKPQGPACFSKEE